MITENLIVSTLEAESAPRNNSSSCSLNLMFYEIINRTNTCSQISDKFVEQNPIDFPWYWNWKIDFQEDEDETHKLDGKSGLGDV